ncbi:hypothetical protein KBI52_21115 [Microvirga sp. HBU67558]|uniref:hypothetical protein n=1 Tax=Microvirga TaxID=186650 RepID=UPI001B3717F0|nr:MULTISPECIES: hypothetical protein [unclassified Microvirga]MBQ0822690.1 hypothetical protein [Microvirga sp. HBU67558]
MAKDEYGFQDARGAILSSNLIIPSLLLSDLTDAKFNGSWQDKLTTGAAYDGSPLRKKESWTLLWCLERAARTQMQTFGLSGLYEEVQTAGFFGALASNLELFSQLDEELRATGFKLFFADCRSDGTETSLGADFAIIIPVSEDEVKLALFQAKKVKGTGVSDVYQVAGNTGKYQIQQLLRSEERLQELAIAPSSDTCEALSQSPFRDAVYYVFWHQCEPSGLLRPTIRPARSVSADLTAGQPDRSYPTTKTWNVDPLHDWIYFSEAVSLLLADETSRFGVRLTRASVLSFLKNGPRPRRVIGIHPPSLEYKLGYWDYLSNSPWIECNFSGLGWSSVEKREIAPSSSPFEI